jgi:hypothetical protein
VFWALVIAGLSVGAFVTPLALVHLGLDTSLVLAGLIAPAAVVLVYPRLASIDRITAARTREWAPRMRVLEALQIFAAAPQAVLERLASSLVETTAEPGSAIVTEGEPADALYVLASGRVEVAAHGELQAEPRHIRFMGAPTYFGEIGVIEKIPRTATVRAVEECELWRIDGDLFLNALNEGSPSRLLIQGMAGRLATTHPSRSPSLLEQPPASDAPASVD